MSAAKHAQPRDNPFSIGTAAGWLAVAGAYQVVRGFALFFAPWKTAKELASEIGEARVSNPDPSLGGHDLVAKPDVVAKPILSEATSSMEQGNHKRALELYENALSLYRQLRDTRGEALAIIGMGDIARVQSNHRMALEFYEKAMSLFHQLGDKQGEAKAFIGLGDIARVQSDYTRALELYEQALPLFHQFGDTLGEARAFIGLGDIARVKNDYKRALGCYERALPLFHQFGDTLGEARAFIGLADIARVQSDYKRASEFYERALPLFRQFGDDDYVEVRCLMGMAHLAAQREDIDKRDALVSAAYRRVARGNVRSADPMKIIHDLVDKVTR